ncbi:ABC transporter permease [Thioclava sp. 15-R06ZXC-3]|uniref:ABC transporter permease n=1 Tax=Thioclava arctica TaxID=3238301 RepID=A0ABV3TH74_9RHOB
MSARFPFFRFSWRRFLAVLSKEFIQMRRDRITFVMMIGVPIMQLMIFGYAINSDPRHLPTLVEMADEGPVSRAVLMGMKTSSYFDFEGVVTSPAQGEAALRDGSANFVVVIPPDFERDVMRGLSPQILLSADASDPTAVGGAASAISGIVDTAMAQTLSGPLAFAAQGKSPFSVVVHRAYNPEGSTSINIVPGLLGVILSMTMVMITAVAIVRETERGTMETLIATPVRPFEVMLGKIAPYVLVGYVQTGVFLLAARALFNVPFTGSALAFFLGFNLFIVTNLALGFLISTVARSQMQAMQLSFFTLLPSILLSGFMFPFAAMPSWAQAIGSAIPTTHFLRLVRKVMLKGAGVGDISGNMLGIAVIMAVIVFVALRRYHQTLD